MTSATDEHLSSPILYSNCPLEQKLSTKFLGVFIDDHFTWKHHINYICNKISKSVGLLYKSRFFLTQKSKISLYYSLVYPYIQYCNIIWSSTYPSSLNRILLLQKRIIRIVANADYLSHTKPLFKNLKILDIFNLNTFSIVCFMFQYHNGLLPSPFLNIFLKNSDIHQYNTRSSHCYRSHTCRTNIKQFTILYNGPKIWNSLPKHITNTSSFSLFKKHLFSYLCKNL